MRRTATMVAVLVVFGLVAGGVASAEGDPLEGTWHERDDGTSNIFWFVDEAVDGVYRVTYYDDWTKVCPDDGPMLWAGFATKTDDTTLQGSFGSVWCPEDGSEVTTLGTNFGFTIDYDPETDTISQREGNCADIGTRQPHVTTVAKAIQELEKGKYPASPGALCSG